MPSKTFFSSEDWRLKAEFSGISISHRKADSHNLAMEVDALNHVAGVPHSFAVFE